jgi:hypothetical protein
MIRITKQDFDTFCRRKDPEVFTEKQINSWILSQQELLQKSETDELNDIEKSEVSAFNDEFSSFMKVEVVSTSDDILTKSLKYDTYYVREQQIDWDMEKGDNDELIKSSHGKYKDTAHNRKMGRVGQEFGHAKKKEDSQKPDVVNGINQMTDQHLDNAIETLSKLLSPSEEAKSSLKELKEERSKRDQKKEDKPEEKKEELSDGKEINEYLPNIVRKLTAEGLSKENYSREKAKKILDETVAGPGLNRILDKFETDVKKRLK